MTFVEALDELEYSVKEKDSNKIVINYKTKLSDIVVIFEHSSKLVRGVIIVKDIVESLDDVSHIYSMYQKMKEDLKTFSEISGYKII